MNKYLFFRIVISLSSFVISFFIWEHLAIFFTDNNIISYYHPIKITTVAKNNAEKEDWRLTHMFVDENFEPDPLLFWKPKKKYPFNSLGFKGKEPIGEISGITTSNIQKDKKDSLEKIFTIITYGDSNTQGLPESSWPEELRMILQKRIKNTQIIVLNAGVAGYSSYQGLLRFKEDLKKYKPDMIIVSFGWNDVTRAISVSDNSFHPIFINLQKVLNQYRVVLVMKYYMNQLFNKPRISGQENLLTRVTSDDYKKILNEFISLAKLNNIQIVLITRPYRMKTEDQVLDKSWRRRVPSYNEILISVSKERNVTIIDLQKIFEDYYSHLFLDESHFTPEGNKQAAEIIADKIIEEKLLE